MTTGNAPTHTCSYFCDKPECIKAQRDELREKLAALDSQPVPVEPEIPTVYYVTIPTGEYASVVTTASLSKWRAYINTMQSALKLAQEERDKWMSLAQANQKLAETAHRRANREQRFKEKAESLNRRMVELMKRMRLELWYCNDQLVNGHGAHEGHTVTAVLAESAELLKEVE